MSKIMNDNFKINVGNPIDSRYLDSSNAPYASVSAVNTAIAQSQRYVGLTVNINNVEYWYGEGVLDGNLVIKDSGIASTGITAASNGLTKVGNAVILGGALTGNTTFTGSTGAVLQYAADYSGGYIARSIPDAGFVTGKTSQSVITANNGLTKSGQNVSLGGALTGNTNILGGNHVLNIGTAGNKVGALTINAISSAILTSGSTEICPTGVLTLDGSAISVKEVVNYDTDKSSSYTLRSLVDAAYVTGNTSLANYYNKTQINSYTGETQTKINSTLSGATNGLTKVGRDVKLGGALTETTIIGNGTQLFGVNAGNINVTGSSINVSGDSLNFSGVMFMVSNPMIGGVEDSILVRASDGKIRQVAGTSLGAITGATNGLTKINQQVKLGGNLTGTTIINAGSNLFSICGANSSTQLTHVDGSGNPQWNLIAAPNEGNYGASVVVKGQSTGSCVEMNANNPAGGVNAGCALIRARNLAGLGYIQLITKTSGNTSTSLEMLSDCNRFVDGINFQGLVYGGDYETNFVPRSLATVQYVTGITSTGIVNATNGLTKTGNAVCLGGTLANDTVINLNNGNCLHICDNGNNTSYIFDQLGVFLCSQNSLFQITGNGNDYKFKHCSGRCVDLNTSGLTYGGDYSAGFKPNTLVTKAYVDSASGGILANNGITREGCYISLGGALTGETTISGTDQLCITAPFNASNAQNFVFDETPTPDAYQEGRLYYKNNSLNFDREFEGVSIQIGEENVVKVENATGSDMFNGQIVYVCGASNDHPIIALSRANALSTSEPTIGMLTQNIANNNEGYVTTLGMVRGLNTGAYAAGDEIYLSASVAGAWTNVQPTYPNFGLRIGTVTKVGTTDGEIFISPVFHFNHVDTSIFNSYTGSTQTALNSKLNVITFNSFSASTDNRLDVIEPVNAKAVTGATNGLTCISARRICLGGTLTAPTTISGTQTLTLGDLNGICMSVANTTDIALNAKNNGAIYLKSQSGTVASSNDMTTAVGIAIDYNASVPLLVTDNRPTPRGLQYNDDYSNTFVDRSLVDKYYVDSIATGLNVHGAVDVATTAADGNLPLTGITGTIDGIAISAITANHNRILVKNQTNGALNGIYSASTGAWVRTEDYNFAPSGEVSNGDLIPVVSGSSNANSQWILVTQNPIVSGDTLTFSLFAQQQGIIDGDGIVVSTSGANREVAIKLSPSNPGLCFEATALELDYSTFSSGLTSNNGKVWVKASPVAAVSDEIPVRFDSSNNLVVDKNDFSYTTAINGLTKIGCDVTLGGALTGDTTINGNSGTHDLSLLSLDGFNLSFNSSVITDNSGGQGLTYGADYKSTFVDNSLVSKAYVINSLTGATSPLTYCDGITRTNGVVQWGGNMTTDRALIRSNNNFCIKSTGIDVIADCSCILATSSAINLRNCVTSTSCDSRIRMTNSGTTEIVANNATQGLTITSPARGAVYAGDYSSNFVDNSLVTKKYVTSQVSGITASAITTADNGLTKTGQNVSLGGNLTGNTTVCLNSHNLVVEGVNNKLSLFGGEATLEGTTVYFRGADTYLYLSDSTYGNLLADNRTVGNRHGLEYFEDYSADYVDRSLVDKGYVNSQISVSAVTAGRGLINNANAFDVNAQGGIAGNMIGISLNAGDCLVIGSGNITSDNLVASAGVFDTSTGSTFLGLKYSCVDFALGIESADIQAVMTGNTFSNGLTKTGTDVKLGGQLSGNTCINIDSGNLYITGGTALGLSLTPNLMYLGAYGGGGNGNYVEVSNEVDNEFIDISTHNATTDIYSNLYISPVDNLLGLYTSGNGQQSYLEVTTSGITAAGDNIAGIQYYADYSGNYTNRSLVDKEYVDSEIVDAITGATLTYENGLTKTGQVVSLGGELLTGGTTIWGYETPFTIDLGNMEGGNFCVDSNNLNLNATNNLSIHTYNGLDKSQCIGMDAMSNRIIACAAYFGDGGSLNWRGIEYGDNYSADFVDRSLVDKQYVTSQVSGITANAIISANNGLTKVGQNVVLGGELFSGTTIFGSQTLNINISTFNVTGATNVTGAVTMSSSLDVSGAIDGNSTLDILGATSLRSTLDVTGATNLRNTLDVTGATNLTGAVAMSSTLDVTGATTLGNTLNVTGATILGSTLEVNGVTTLNSVVAGSATDDVLTITSSGEIQKIPASSLGEDNNVYAMSVVTTNITLTTGSSYVQLVNSSGSSVTITLPAFPIDGQVFRIKDAAGAALSYPITIARNGKMIDNGTNDGVLNTDGGALELVYNNALNSWFVFSFVN